MENIVILLLAVNWLFLLYNFSMRSESYVPRHSHFYEPIYSEDESEVTGYFCMGCGISSNKK